MGFPFQSLLMQRANIWNHPQKWPNYLVWLAHLSSEDDKLKSKFENSVMQEPGGGGKEATGPQIWQIN